jgi:glycolate oxidase iron-sulfur subunit
MDPLKRVEKEIKKCVKCGACRAHCPVFGELRREPAVARGKVAIAQAVLSGGIWLDDRTYADMSKCLLCGSCVEKCANDVPTDEIVIAAREALAQKRGLTSFHKAVGRVIRNRKLMNMGTLAAAVLGPLFFRRVPATSGLRLRFPLPFVGGKRHIPNIANKPFMKRHPEVIAGVPGKPRIVYFVGCMTNFVYTEVGEAALALFRHLGCTVIIPRDQQCCGLPGMSGGDLATVRELAEKNLAALERHRADYIVTACATCGGALHKFYPAVIGKRHPELLERCKAIAEKTVDAAMLLQKLGLNPAETGDGGRAQGHLPRPMSSAHAQYHATAAGAPQVLPRRGICRDGRCRQMLRSGRDLQRLSLRHLDGYQRRQKRRHPEERCGCRGNRLSGLHDAALGRPAAGGS